MLKNCDKTKLIYWNSNLPVGGNEKYLIVSADLILDQDYFWEKTSPDNGNSITNFCYNSTTLTTLNHNSTPTYRKISTNTYVQGKFLPGSAQSIPTVTKNTKNCLLNSPKMTSVIKEWKLLHSKCS